MIWSLLSQVEDFQQRQVLVWRAIWTDDSSHKWFVFMIKVNLVALVIDLVDLRRLYFEERMAMIPANNLLRVADHLLLNFKG